MPLALAPAPVGEPAKSGDRERRDEDQGCESIERRRGRGSPGVVGERPVLYVSIEVVSALTPCGEVSHDDAGIEGTGERKDRVDEDRRVEHGQKHPPDGAEGQGSKIVGGLLVAPAVHKEPGPDGDDGIRRLEGDEADDRCGDAEGGACCEDRHENEEADGESDLRDHALQEDGKCGAVRDPPAPTVEGERGSQDWLHLPQDAKRVVPEGATRRVAAERRRSGSLEAGLWFAC